MEERLKELRTCLGMNQKDFAKSLSLGQSTWAMIEVGKRDLNDRHVKLICTIYDVNEDWLRTGEGEMFEQLTDQQKVIKHTAQLLKDTDSVIANAIKAFIVTYEQLDTTSKKVLEDVALKCLDNIKKGQ